MCVCSQASLLTRPPSQTRYLSLPLLSRVSRSLAVSWDACLKCISCDRRTPLRACVWVTVLWLPPGSTENPSLSRDGQQRRQQGGPSSSFSLTPNITWANTHLTLHTHLILFPLQTSWFQLSPSSPDWPSICCPCIHSSLSLYRLSFSFRCLLIVCVCVCYRPQSDSV